MSRIISPLHLRSPFGNIESEMDYDNYPFLDEGQIWSPFFIENIRFQIERYRDLIGKIYFSFYFSPHVGFDGEDLKSMFKDCHIYVPEINGWTSDIIDDLQSLSDSSLGANLLSNGLTSFPLQSNMEQSLIHGSGKLITVFDLKYNHYLVDEINRFRRSFRDRIAILDQNISSMDDLLILVCNYFNGNRIFIDLMRQREEHMMCNMFCILDDLFTRNNHLNSLNMINVLSTLGSGHIIMATTLRDLGLNVQYRYGNTDSVSHYFSALQNEFRLGKVVNNELYLRAFFDRWIIEYFIPDDMFDNFPWNVFCKDVTSKLTVVDIYELFSKIFNEGSVSGVVFFKQELCPKYGIDLKEFFGRD